MCWFKLDGFVIIRDCALQFLATFARSSRPSFPFRSSRSYARRSFRSHQRFSPVVSSLCSNLVRATMWHRL